jgi:hypothetical protein
MSEPSDLPDFVSSSDSEPDAHEYQVEDSDSSDDEVEAQHWRAVVGSGGKREWQWGGGGAEGQGQSDTFSTPIKTQGTKRKAVDVSAGQVVAVESPGSGSPGAIVAVSPASDSARKAQRTLNSFWQLPGPQTAVHRSPDWFVKSEQYARDAALREKLALEQWAKVPGEWLEPVQKLPHSGGNKGGRPAVGAVRGQAAGDSRNARRQGQAVLRRDPSLAYKLAVLLKVEAAAKDCAAVASHVRREIERDTGFSWRTIQQWIVRKPEFQSEFSRRRLGKHGLKPFGSNLSASKKKSHSLGARLRKGTVNYQTAVLQQLQVWFDRERQYGHQVSVQLLKDFYMKFLERASAVCKTLLISVDQDTVSLKEKAVASGWGSGGEQQLDKPLQSEDQQLVLKTAENLQKKQQLLLKQKQQLDDRIVKMGKMDFLSLLLSRLELLRELFDNEICLLIGQYSRGLVVDLMTFRRQVLYDCITTNVDLTRNLKKFISGRTSHTTFGYSSPCS